VATSSCATD
jgi:hypothetical protein